MLFEIQLRSLELNTINFIYESARTLRKLDWENPMFYWMLISAFLIVYIFYMRSVHNKAKTAFNITRKSLAKSIIDLRGIVEKYKNLLEKSEANKLELVNRMTERLIEVENMFKNYKDELLVSNDLVKLEWIRELIADNYPAENLAKNLNRSQLIYKLKKLRESQEEFET